MLTSAKVKSFVILSMEMFILISSTAGKELAQLLCIPSAPCTILCSKDGVSLLGWWKKSGETHPGAPQHVAARALSDDLRLDWRNPPCPWVSRHSAGRGSPPSLEK